MPLENVTLGAQVKIPYPDLVNLYGCTIGDNCFIGPFVEIQKGVTIGNDSRIQSHSFICEKVTIGKGVFVSHGVTFVNDRYPPRFEKSDWEETRVGDGAVIGSNATILPCTIGARALIGAGAVVVKDVPEDTIVAGNPAKVIRHRPHEE